MSRREYATVGQSLVTAAAAIRTPHNVRPFLDTGLMDKVCTTCGRAVKRGPLCRSCSVRAAWIRKRGLLPVRLCKICEQPIPVKPCVPRVYCSRACYLADPTARPGRKPNRVTKTCPGCSEQFSVPVSNAHRYTHCSKACSDTRGRDGSCERCGGHFRYSQTETRRFCSETCRRPPLLMTCGHCGTGFRTQPSREGRARYCSKRCYRASDAETGIERRVRELLEAWGQEHVVQAQIGPWVVDFLLGDLVIEADGDYWHSLRPEVDARKSRDLEQRGYVVLRLPENEIVADDFPARFAVLLQDARGRLGGQDSHQRAPTAQSA